MKNWQSKPAQSLIFIHAAILFSCIGLAAGLSGCKSKLPLLPNKGSVKIPPIPNGGGNGAVPAPKPAIPVLSSNGQGVLHQAQSTHFRLKQATVSINARARNP